MERYQLYKGTYGTVLFSEEVEEVEEGEEGEEEEEYEEEEEEEKTNPDE